MVVTPGASTCRVIALRRFLALLLFLVAVPLVADQPGDLWDRAVDAVQHRRYGEAMPLLEVMLERNADDVRALTTLAAVYEMDGRTAEAERLLRGSMDDTRRSNTVRGRAAFELAALLARQEAPQEAVAIYTTSLEYDSALVPVYLNRANLRVKLGEYPDAVRDYERFLALRPNTSQRESIEAMIALLRESIQVEEERRAEEERRRQEEEEARRIAEEARREQEERERRVAEERRQQMMDSVMESLGSARDDARATQADREGIIDFEDDLDLLD